MIKRYFFLFVVLLFLSFSAEGQYYGWSIYSHFQFSSKGCDLPKYEDYLSGEPALDKTRFIEKTMAPPPPPPPPPLPPELEMEDASREQKFQLIRRDLPEIFSNLAEISTLRKPSRRIDLYGGNHAFFKHDKWGIKDLDGKILLNPEFDYILADTIGKGFAAYQGTKCKYYSAAGKEILNQPFYGINPIDTTTFLVHGEQGFGIIRDGEMLIEPDCKAITISLKRNYFKVKDKNNVELLYLPDFKTKLVYPVFKYRDADLKLYGQDFLVVKDRVLIDIQQAKRLFTCDAGYTFKVLDAERELFLIKKDDKKYSFPIARNGRILKDTAFSMFLEFDENGLAIASPAFKKKIPRMSGLQNVVGLINKNLEWVLEPAYQQIAWKGDHYLLKLPWRFGIANTEGKVIVPNEYSKYSKYREGQYFIGIGIDKENAISKLIDIQTGQVLKDSFPFYNYQDFEFCKKQYLLAELRNGTKQLLDENLNSLTPAYNYFYKWRDYLVTKDYGSNRVTDTNYVYNCDFEKMTFKIGDIEISHFNQVKAITSELDYFILNDQAAYIVDQEGNGEQVDYKIDSSFPLGIYDLVVVRTAFSEYEIINQKGAVILPMLFSQLSYNQEIGLIRYVYQPDKIGFIDIKGDFIFDGSYEAAKYLGLGLFAVKREGQWAVVNQKNEIVLPYHPEEYQMMDGLMLRGTIEEGVYFDISGRQIR